MPRTVKQYFRAVLSSVGLFNKTAFRLAIDEVRPDDVFIVSFPKSGNTWMRFITANLISREKITFRNIDDIIPDVYMFREKVNTAKSPRYIKTHQLFRDDFPRTIYIVRDLRDVALSYFHYQVSLGEFSRDIDSFVSELSSTHPFGEWGDHVMEAYTFHSSHPDRILIIRYEDLQADMSNELKRICSFLHIEPVRTLQEVSENCKFETLRAEENRSGSIFRDISGKNFFREGRTGSWKTEMGAETVKKLIDRGRNHEAMKRAGYIL